MVSEIDQSRDDKVSRSQGDNCFRLLGSVQDEWELVVSSTPTGPTFRVLK